MRPYLHEPGTDPELDLQNAQAPAEAPSDLLRRCLALVDRDLAAAETELAGLLRSPIAAIPNVVGHLAFAGGKRFRPLLTLLSAAAAGLDDPARITIAAVGELLHTATLLHDDVIDEGEFRRGRPTARMEYGNQMAVLSGDYCLARSLQAVARLGRLEAVQTMGDAVTLMAEGEVAQLHAAGDFSLDRDRYYGVIERKTAALIAWCSSVAGLVDAPLVEPLRRFGLELGYAFQIADDLLDVAGPAAATGKEPGQDLRDGKMTLPLIVACEARPSLRARVSEALEAGPPMSPEVADGILSEVASTGAIEETTAIAQAHADTAIASLAEVPDCEARRALIAVAHFVVRRRN